jgi:hypothetical protein
MSWIGPPGSIRNLSTCGADLWPGNNVDDELDQAGYDNRTAVFASYQRATDQARAETPDKFVYSGMTSQPLQYFPPDSYGEQLINSYVDVVGSDDFLSSSPNRCNASDPNYFPFALPAGEAPPTVAHCRDAQSYGKLTDALHNRDDADGKYKPVASVLDIRSGADPAAHVQTPAATEAAGISNVIHGAGFLLWFPLSFDPACRTDRLADVHVPACAKPYQDAMARANQFVKLVAPWLNSQPYDWSFGSGVETRLSVHGNLAVVLAMTDGGTGSRTFTLPPDLAGVDHVAAVERADGTSRTLPVTDGKFVDTFAASTDYRAYVVAVPS